ncbi:MAG: PAS domain S-box protein, partial [candidate division Zixibacteria bacterium]|nr:PAS domain S-box protein [candidate division Zixibacteria bacterium]
YIIATTKALIIVLDRNGRIVEFNPACEHAAGYNAEEAKGNILWEFLLPEDEVDSVRAVFENLSADILPSQFENHWVARDGTMKYIAWSNTNVKDSHGRIEYIIGTGIDITEKRQVRKELQLNKTRLAAILRLNRMTSATRQEITDKALTEGIRLSDSRIGFLAVISEDGATLSIPSWSKPADREKLVANRPLICSTVSAGSWAEAIRSGTPDVNNRKMSIDRLRRGYPGDYNSIECQLCVPVLEDGRVVAAMGVADKATDYTEDDARQLSLLMEEVWRVIQRHDAQEALEASEKRYRLLIETMNEGLGIFDENCYVTYVNERLCRMLGYTSGELVGRSVSVFLDEANKCTFYDQIARGKEGRNSYELECTAKSGRKIPTIVSPQPVFDNTGNFVGSFAVVTNISHQKEVEATLKATNDKLEIEQTTLKEKNIALRELMSQIENEKKQIRLRIQTNVDRVLMPTLRILGDKSGNNLRGYVRLLENSLNDITSGFVRNLETRFATLSPREVEICNMIKRGLSTKDIANNLHTSIHTVHNQRKRIRRKFEIDNQNVNLSSFLQTF